MKKILKSKSFWIWVIVGALLVDMLLAKLLASAPVTISFFQLAVISALLYFGWKSYKLYGSKWLRKAKAKAKILLLGILLGILLCCSSVLGVLSKIGSLLT